MLSAIAITNIVKHIGFKYADRIYCATQGKHLNYSKITYRFPHGSQAHGREFDVGIASITLTKHEKNLKDLLDLEEEPWNERPWTKDLEEEYYKNKINFIDVCMIRTTTKNILIFF